MVFENHLPSANMSKRTCCLAIGLILLSPMALMDVAQAAGRVFYDDFESYSAGTLPQTQWKAEEISSGVFRTLPSVVTSAADGIAGPYAGSKMLRSNSTSGNNGETAFLNTTNYTNELFVRVRVRVDANHDLTGGSPRKILRFFFWNGNVYRDLFEVIANFGGNQGLSAQAAWTDNGSPDNMPTYWGDASGDISRLPTAWHKVEYYINHAEHRIKVWHDGVLRVNQTQTNGGQQMSSTKWTPFYINSNWEDAHDATNYVYFDNFEVFSDLGSGGTGLMSDATITQGGGGGGDTTPPAVPMNLRIQ